jgi:hypothetical protein
VERRILGYWVGDVTALQAHYIHLTHVCRSKTGLVNLYGSESIVASTSGAPKPLKTIGNLTTSISTMRFNHDAQILALASKSKKDQLKMVCACLGVTANSLLTTDDGLLGTPPLHDGILQLADSDYATWTHHLDGLFGGQ